MNDSDAGPASRKGRTPLRRFSRDGGIAFGAVLLAFLLQSKCFTPAPVAVLDCKPREAHAPALITCVNESRHARTAVWVHEEGRKVAEDHQHHSAVLLMYEAPGTKTIELWVSGTTVVETSQKINILPPLEQLPEPLNLSVTARTKGTSVVVNREEQVRAHKSDHPSYRGKNSRDYSRTFRASLNARIVGHSWKETDAANAGPLSFEIREDGRLGVASFRLTSGPKYDRWDGWLRGVLTIRESKEVPGGVVSLVSGLQVERVGLYLLEGAPDLQELERWTVHLVNDEAPYTGASDSQIAPATSAVLLSLEPRNQELFLRVERREEVGGG